MLISATGGEIKESQEEKKSDISRGCCSKGSCQKNATQKQSEPNSSKQVLEISNQLVKVVAAKELVKKVVLNNKVKKREKVKILELK